MNFQQVINKQILMQGLVSTAISRYSQLRYADDFSTVHRKMIDEHD